MGEMAAVPVVVMTDNGRRSLNGAAVTEWAAVTWSLTPDA